MTAIRQRRTRATVVGLVAAVIGLVAVAVLSFAGLETLADSTAGRRAADPSPSVASQRLPFTSTALLGVVDVDGRLASLAVAVLEADGTGGSIVQLPVSADPGSGQADTMAPLDAIFTVAGPLAFREAVERLTGLSFDVIEIVDPERLAQLITPLGELEITLPGIVADASSGEVWTPGAGTAVAAEATRLITAFETGEPAWTLEPVRAAVWRAVADRVGAGIGSAEPVEADTDLAVPTTTDEFVDRLFAGPVQARAIQFAPLDDDRAADRFDPAFRQAFGADLADSVVVVDRAEMLMVFGGIAPTRLGAPLDAPTFRLVNGLTDADADGLGRTVSDLTHAVVVVLDDSKVNVVSVVDRADIAVPEVTQIRVADAGLAHGLEATYEPHLGEIEVSVVEAAIEGIDVEIVLGRSFLDRLAADPAIDVAGSTPDK